MYGLCPAVGFLVTKAEFACASVQVMPSELVRCNPDRGRVPSGGTLDMELTLSCMEPQQVNTQVSPIYTSAEIDAGAT